MLKNLQGANFFLILSLGAMLIGFAPVFVKWSELSSSAILFWRMFLALPMLAILNYFINKTFIFKVKMSNNSPQLFKGNYKLKLMLKKRKNEGDLQRSRN